MTEVDIVKNSDRVDFDKPTMLIECCDCCLTHLLVLRWDGEIPYLQVYRDDKSTDEARKELTKRQRREIVEIFGGNLK